MAKKSSTVIVEKRLGIPADYQLRAYNSDKYLQKNWHRNKFVALKTYLSLTGKNIVDLGTGSGNFEFVFSPIAKSIVGIDYNDEALAFLKKELQKRKIRNVKLLCSDVRKTSSYTKELKNAHIVVMIDVIEHIHHEDAQIWIKALYKALPKNSSVCIITPNYQSPWALLENILDRSNIFPKFKEEQHLAKYDATNLPQLFQENGFTTKFLSSFNLFSWLVPSESFSAYLTKIELESRFTMGNLLMGVFTK